MAKNDHAILFAINEYPKLDPRRRLYGTENDLKRFQSWLTDDKGGQVPPENIKCIMSSQFRDIETTPNPTEIVFRQALKQLLKDTSGADKAPNAGGNRLYLYFAGHGMTRERLA